MVKPYIEFNTQKRIEAEKNTEQKRKTEKRCIN